MKFRPKLLTVIFLAISALSSVWLYRDSFGSYFFQDDWFSFRISQANSITQFFQFFVPRKDIIYFRPLGMQLPFFLIYRIFGLNPLAFRILTISTHAVNVFLVYYLIRLITKSQFVALLTSFFYSSSFVHYIPMYWSATYSFVLGPTFFFLIFIGYLKRKYKLSFILFITGILVNEIVIITPFILWLYNFFIKNNKKSGNLILLFIIAGVYFLARLFLFTAPIEGDYELLAGSHILNNLQAYLLWSFNWPEEMKAQFVNFYTVNPVFVKDFYWYYLVFLTSLIINVLLFYFIPLAWRSFNSIRSNALFFLFTFSWFIFGLTPVLLFPKHAFSYYLPISLVGLLTMSCYSLFHLLIKIYKKFPQAAYLIILVITTSWFYTSFISSGFNNLVHWVPKRAKISENIIRDFFKVENVDKDKKFSVLDTSENRLSLNNQDAVKFLFGMDSEVIYVKVK